MDSFDLTNYIQFLTKQSSSTNQSTFCEVQRELFDQVTLG